MYVCRMLHFMLPVHFNDEVKRKINLRQVIHNECSDYEMCFQSASHRTATGRAGQ